MTAQAVNPFMTQSGFKHAEENLIEQRLFGDAK